MNAEPPRRAGPGRPKGLRNVVTRTMKSLTLGALDAVGGQRHLERMATSKVASDRAAFMALLGRLVPLEVAGQIDAALSVRIIKLTHPDFQRVVPSQGTCVIGESERVVPMSSPSEGEIPSETAVEIEEQKP